MERRRCRRLRHERAGCSSGREWLLSPEGTAHGAALGLGCCAVVAQRGHHCCRSEWCKQACNTRLCVHCLREMVFFSRWDGGCGAALGCCCAARTSVLQVTCWGARKTHAMISPFRQFFFAFSSSADLPWSTRRLSRICRFPLYAPQQINWFRRSEWRTLNAVSETSLLAPLVGPLRSNFTC